MSILHNSWVTALTFPTVMPPVDAMSHTAIHLFPKICSLMRKMFTCCTSASWMWACSRLKTSLWFSETYCTNHRHWVHITVSSSYKEFLLASLPLSPGMWKYTATKHLPYTNLQHYHYTNCLVNLYSFINICQNTQEMLLVKVNLGHSLWNLYLYMYHT
jgi:hypothetical protein